MSRNRWRDRWQARRCDLGALALIVLFFVAFFWRALFTGKFFVTSDAFIYSYPLRTLVWEQLRQGKLPLWTSQIMSGYPLLSMAQIGIGYPLTWFYLFLPGRFAETIYDLAPYVLFPIFSYCYLREVGRSRTASIMAALALGYGGFLISPVAYNGLLGNALMWLPLLLIAIERARTRSFVRCLLPATAAYSMSLLSGVGQGFVLAGTVAILYAAFVVLVIGPGSDEGSNPRTILLSWARWRPMALTLCAMLLSAGVAAFQILETLRAQRRSIRSHLSYETFSVGSYRPGEALKSFFLPLYYHLEACGYAPLLVLVLAVIAIVAALKSSERDRHVFFWAGLAVSGFVLTLGQNTPVFKLIYYIPPLNLFRGAARHAFELSLGTCMLSAYGWDQARAFAERVNFKAVGRRQKAEGGNKRSRDRALALTFVASLLMLVAGVFWLLDIARIPVGEMEVYYYPPNGGEWHYAFWKFFISLLSLFAIWQAWKVRAMRTGAGLALAVIALACFFEPSVMAARWWWPTLKPASRFTTPSPTTKFLQKYPADQNRVYSYAYPFIEEYAVQPRLEPSNLTVLYGLQDVAGYEPLILSRYSRALGDTYVDAVRPRPGYEADNTLFESSSHVLDLLNTRFVVSYPYLQTEPATPIEKDGIKFTPRDLDKTIKPGETVTLKGAAADADTLALVTSTAFSADEPDGTQVASMRLFSPTGKMIERPLRVGIDTAEWAHDRPDVRSIVRHSLARVFSASPGDATFSRYNFISRLPFDLRMTVDHLEIQNVTKKVVLILNKATLFDSATNFSMPLPHYDLNKWKPVYADGGAQILRNERALPRAWLVAEAESIDGEEALARIRGQGGAFDPKRTALLEIQPQNLPSLPGGPISRSASARVVAYENNRLVIETVADTAAVLVVSEVNYPGWIATIDGARAPIHTADFLLRGVILPAGSHRMEMRYTAPAARNGALISLASLIFLAALGVREKQKAIRGAGA